MFDLVITVHQPSVTVVAETEAGREFLAGISGASFPEAIRSVEVAEQFLGRLLRQATAAGVSVQ